MKFGIWFAIAVVAFIWFNHAKKQRLRHRSRAAAAEPAAPASAAAAGIERMVPCAHCGLHIPVSDASLAEGGAVFCSEAHRRLRSRG